MSYGSKILIILEQLRFAYLLSDLGKTMPVDRKITQPHLEGEL